MIGANGANNKRGMMSNFDTRWQKLPPHRCRWMARESGSFPIKGEPKVKQITEGGEEIDWR